MPRPRKDETTRAIAINEEVHRLAKILAAYMGVSIKDVVEFAIEDLATQHNVILKDGKVVGQINNISIVEE